MASFDSKRMFKDTEEQTINSDLPGQVVKEEEKEEEHSSKNQEDQENLEDQLEETSQTISTAIGSASEKGKGEEEETISQ